MPSHSASALTSEEVSRQREKTSPETTASLVNNHHYHSTKSSPISGSGNGPGNMGHLRLPPLTYNNGVPSLMVNLDLSFLDRIPPFPLSDSSSKELRKGVAPCVVPSKVRLPKEGSGTGDRRPPPPPPQSATEPVVAAAKGKTKSLTTSSVDIDGKATVSPVVALSKASSSDKIEGQGRPSKRSANDGDLMKSDKKVRLSKEPGPSPSSSVSASPSSSSIKGHKSKMSEVRAKAICNEMPKGDPIKKERTEPKHNRMASHGVHQPKDSSVDRKSHSLTTSVTSKRDKKTEGQKESSGKSSRITPG